MPIRLVVELRLMFLAGVDAIVFRLHCYLRFHLHCYFLGFPKNSQLDFVSCNSLSYNLLLHQRLPFSHDTGFFPQKFSEMAIWMIMQHLQSLQELVHSIIFQVNTATCANSDKTYSTTARLPGSVCCSTCGPSHLGPERPSCLIQTDPLTSSFHETKASRRCFSLEIIFYRDQLQNCQLPETFYGEARKTKC